AGGRTAAEGVGATRAATPCTGARRPNAAYATIAAATATATTTKKRINEPLPRCVERRNGPRARVRVGAARRQRRPRDESRLGGVADPAVGRGKKGRRRGIAVDPRPTPQLGDAVLIQQR